MANRRPPSLWRKVLLYGLGLPATTLLTAAAVYYGELNLSSNGSPGDLALLPPVRPAERILVIAPHPDDEVIGCGGLIERARRVGADVRVAIVTNGEAFSQGVRLESRKLEPRPADYAAYAKERREESLRALASLGVPAENVRFLGFPDRRLQQLWTAHWEEPLEVRLSAYPGLCAPVVTGSALVESLARVLVETRPDTVYVTHPLDDHGDHSGSYVFLQAALLRYEAETDARPALRCYLVHRGDWPMPQGRHTEDPLLPPKGFLGSRALELPLEPDEVRAKQEAVRDHRTQAALTGRFLSSFVRANELFFDMDGLPEAGTAPLSEEPRSDTLARQMQAGLDLTAIVAQADGSRLRVRADVAGKVIRSAQYRIVVRGFGADGRSHGAFREAYTPGRGARDAAHSKRAVEWSIPLAELGHPSVAAIRVETWRLGLTQDRSDAVFTRLPAR